jgi:hypothetical protein
MTIMTIMPEVYQLKFGVVLGMVVLIDDSSAKEMAIKVAMENNLCLIQGPPGTGKVSLCSMTACVRVCARIWGSMTACVRVLVCL